MIEVRYTRSEYDNCVYFRGLSDISYIYLLFYVNDMLIITKSLVEVNKVKSHFSMEFDIKYLGEV